MYLSAHVPRWLPRTEADLQSAIDGDLLEESHYLDLKREIAPKTKGNKELARDLAQFAIDGGVLLVGVAEGTDGAPHALFPVELAGLSERVEQVARTAIDPPLAVRSHSIPSTGDPTKGYLLIEVPISPSAPHMVESIYYGRGDKVRDRLTDPQVLRLHQRRVDARADARMLLLTHVKRDPILPTERKNAHFFAVASPVRPRSDEMLLEYVDDWASFFDDAARAARDAHTALPPNITETQFLSRRSDGMGRTQALDQDRILRPGFLEDHTVEIEFSESGAVRIFNGRLSAELETSDLARADRKEMDRQILSEIAVDTTRHLLAVACFVSERVGYLGPWHVGVAATGIRGLYARPGPKESQESALTRLARMQVGYVFSPPRYPHDEDAYYGTESVSLLDMQQMPGATARKLLGRFLRTLGMDDRYDVSLADVPASSN